MKASVLILVTLFTALGIVKAQDRQFAYTYQSNTLAKGMADLEVWNTYHAGRETYYHALAQRVEFEVGVARNLQTALYINASHKSMAPLAGTSEFIQESSFSVSSEWKYQLSDPGVSALGSALYAEITVAPNEYEFEGKLILDKRIKKNLFAFNAVGEYEIEYEAEDGEVEREWETSFEFNLAYLYNITPNFGLGVELKNHNEINDEGALEHSALFGGPTVYFSGDGFFFILSAQPQWTNLKGGGLELEEHERMETRLLFAINIR